MLVDIVMKGDDIMLKKQFGLSMILVIILVVGGCGWFSDDVIRVQKSETVMDTVASLTATGENADEAVTEGLARLREIEAVVGHGPDSDVTKLVSAAGNGQWVPLRPETVTILTTAQKYAELTDGAFDITTGPLVKLWGIGTDKARVPSEAEIAEARALVGWRYLAVDEAHQQARLVKAGMSIDLGSIAKGFAIDEVRKIYRKYGIENGLINLGASSLYAIGDSPKGKPWRIGIRHPRNKDKKMRLGVVDLEKQALSTSGDYERYFEADGERYHHIIDPKTGYPAKTGIMSVTVVVADDEPAAGMMSDLLTTAVFVLGPDKGSELLNKLPTTVKGMICTNDYQLHVTNDFGTSLHDIHDDFSLANQ